MLGAENIAVNLLKMTRVLQSSQYLQIKTQSFSLLALQSFLN